MTPSQRAKKGRKKIGKEERSKRMKKVSDAATESRKKAYQALHGKQHEE